MIPVQETAKDLEAEPRRVGPPSRFHLDILGRFVQLWSCQGIVKRERSRKYRPVLNSRSCDLAVLCQGDFIRRVGRAYRMSATNRPRHAFPRLSGTSAGVIRQQGLHSSCGECQNTAPHGARFLTDVGRTHGLKVSKVSSSLARRPEKQRLRKTRGYR
jgi:hypothetical protein